MSAMANRTVIVDNNTWNNTHIATVRLEHNLLYPLGPTHQKIGTRRQASRFTPAASDPFMSLPFSPSPPLSSPSPPSASLLCSRWAVHWPRRRRRPTPSWRASTSTTCSSSSEDSPYVRHTRNLSRWITKLYNYNLRRTHRTSFIHGPSRFHSEPSRCRTSTPLLTLPSPIPFPLQGYSSDDINKFLWPVRIGSGVYPNDMPSEKDFLNPQVPTPFLAHT